MAKLVIWDDAEAKKELNKRLQFCRAVRKPMEREWEENERTLNSTKSTVISGNYNVTFDTLAEMGMDDVDQGNTDYGVNYAFKNYRFIHSQLSANPPSVISRPTSNDPSDKRKADAADRLIRYGIRKYQMQELFDLCTASTLQHGTGFIKSLWDPDRGDIADMDDETGELTMDGDLYFCVPSPWDIYLDPDAQTWADVKFIFERIVMPYEEACFRFPDRLEVLKKYRIKDDIVRDNNNGRSSTETRRYDVVEIFQYWEKGLPYNGMVGRHCYITKDGDPLTPVKPNPFRFAPPMDRGVDMPEEEYTRRQEVMARAQLPYHVLTDIDITGSPWGRSFIAYEAPLQDLYNRLLNVVVDNLQANGVARIILPEGAEIADDSITNGPYDIIKTTGNRDPKFMDPMVLPAAISEMFSFVRQGLDDMAGVNEAMFGQQSREQSGFSMQYATNQGNMIRRRLFNKYVLLVESVYKSYLNLIRKHWTEKRTIWVLGKEKAFEALDIKGADIDGGFDIVVEYGASLSLDPTTRREEIITLMPLFEKAGVEVRNILSMLKLNELEGLYDTIQLAADRQRELFEEMIRTGQYLPPKELQDHKNMLAFAYTFVMTTEYKYLDPDNQALIDRHIKERETMAAAGAQPSAGIGAPGPAGSPQGAPPPLPGAQAPMEAQNAAPAIAPGA